MEITNHQPSLVRPNEGFTLAGGVLIIVLSFILEYYRVNSAVVITGMSTGLLTVEAALLYIIYRSMVSSKHKLRHWTKRSVFVSLVVSVIAFIWTLMLYEIGKVIFIVLTRNHYL